MDRKTAYEIVCKYVKDVGLRRHMVAVEIAMRYYAKHFGEDEATWGLAGLLHDFDWEIHPTLEDHPAKGAAILRKREVPEEVVQAILSHNTEGTGVERKSALDYALLACDEITGLIIAVGLVRPTKDLRDAKLKSVKKKWKDRSFAAGVDRDHVEEAVEDFSRECFEGKLELWEHIENVLVAMQEAADELGLDGRLAEDG